MRAVLQRSVLSSTSLPSTQWESLFVRMVMALGGTYSNYNLRKGASLRDLPLN
jgi:hypothetical protein